jgi:hypothetical protein
MNVMMLKTITAGFFAVLVSSSLLAGSLSDYKADIRATRHGILDIKLKGSMSFKISDQGEWAFKLDIKGGPVKSSEVSTGMKVGNEYRPSFYRRNTKVFFSKENIEWQFDWTKNTVTGKVKKDSLKFDMPQTIHDPLSYQIPIREALATGDKTFNFQYMRYKRPGELEFEVVGEELLMLENGRVHTIILKQTKPQRKNEKKLIWVALKHDYVPVRFTTYNENKIKDDVVVEKLWIDNQLVVFDD